jgi:hypothetical protein
MSLHTRPKIRIQSADGESSPIQATLEHGGRIRLITDPDAMHHHTAWLTAAEAREFATELLGLADAADIIHAED